MFPVVAILAAIKTCFAISLIIPHSTIRRAKYLPIPRYFEIVLAFLAESLPATYHITNYNAPHFKVNAFMHMGSQPYPQPS